MKSTKYYAPIFLFLIDNKFNLTYAFVSAHTEDVVERNTHQEKEKSLDTVNMKTNFSKKEVDEKAGTWWNL